MEKEFITSVEEKKEIGAYISMFTYGIEEDMKKIYYYNHVNINDNVIDFYNDFLNKVNELRSEDLYSLKEVGEIFEQAEDIRIALEQNKIMPRGEIVKKSNGEIITVDNNIFVAYDKNDGKQRIRVKRK